MAIGSETIDEYAEELARAGQRNMHMGRAELASDIADLIVKKLGASVIPSSFPAHIGSILRETAKHGAYRYVYMLPGGGPYVLSVEFVVNPDGTLNMEFRDPSGIPFWRGTFRPAEEV